MKKYKVIITNRILGNYEMILTKKQLDGFNLVASRLAERVDRHGGEHSEGMWTVLESEEQ